MRKIIFFFTALMVSQFSFGQVIQDNATIPVSVTLNSILRLQVKTGGNIQFVFNTMAQYNTGITNTPGTTTTFTVASSRNFTVTMGTEDAAFNGVETGLTIPLAVVEYDMGGTGLGSVTPGTYRALLNAATPIINLGLAGGADAGRTFEILWQAGENAGFRVLNYTADVYVTNVFLNLQPR